MLKSDPQSPIPNDVLEQASAWILRLEDHPVNEPLLKQHREWLQSSAEHQRAWAQACRVWDMAGQTEHGTSALMQATDIGPANHHDNVISIRPEQKTGYASAGSSPSRLRSVFGWATAAAAAVFMLLGAQPMMFWLKADVATGAGQMQTVTLEDGSNIVVGADSGLGYTISAQNRSVTLLKGEAWFDVAEDPSRPFIVNAGELSVSVTGTQFNVGITDRTLSVALAEGSVQIERNGAQQTSTLSPGQRYRLDLDSGHAEIVQIDPIQMGAWRNHRLVVQDMPLADVVHTIDRYYSGVIHIWRSERVADVRITGVFDLSEPESALNTLVGSYDASLLELTPWVLVVSPD